MESKMATYSAVLLVVSEDDPYFRIVQGVLENKTITLHLLSTSYFFIFLASQKTVSTFHALVVAKL